jgi:hypothetical protein
VDGNPALLIDPSCRLWITGMQGGYQFKEVKTASGMYAGGEIVKNRYSHPCEAGQYMLLGMGLGGRLLYGETGQRPEPVQTRQTARVFDRGRRVLREAAMIDEETRRRPTLATGTWPSGASRGWAGGTFSPGRASGTSWPSPTPATPSAGWSTT